MGFFPAFKVMAQINYFSMNKKTLFIITAAASFIAASLASCSRNENFLGSWTEEKPRDITALVPAASTATSQLSLDFTQGEAGESSNGPVYISSVISLQQPVDANPSVISGYEVSVAATASVSGVWSYKPGSNNDIVITLNPSTFRVDVDNHGVTFTENLLTEQEKPVLDSLSQATAEQWKAQLTPAMEQEFNSLNNLSDVKVEHPGTLTFKTEDPEVTYTFVK